MTQSDERALTRAAKDSAAHRTSARNSIDATNEHIRQSDAAILRPHKLLKNTLFREGPLGDAFGPPAQIPSTEK